MNVIRFPFSSEPENTTIPPALRAGNRHLVDLYGGREKSPKKPEPQYAFWSSYFGAREAKIIADIDFRVKYGQPPLRERMIFEQIQARMRASKEPFTLGMVLVDVENELVRLKAAIPLTSLEGGRVLRRPAGGGSLSRLSLVT